MSGESESVSVSASASWNASLTAHATSIGRPIHNNGLTEITRLDTDSAQRTLGILDKNGASRLGSLVNHWSVIIRSVIGGGAIEALRRVPHLNLASHIKIFSIVVALSVTQDARKCTVWRLKFQKNFHG